MASFKTFLKYLWDRITAPSAWAAGGIMAGIVDNINAHGWNYLNSTTFIFALMGIILPGIPKLSVDAPLSPSAIVKTNAIATVAGIGIQDASITQKATVAAANGGSTNLKTGGM